MPLQNAEYYDEMHKNCLRNAEHYSTVKYYEMWKRIVVELWKEGVWYTTLDIGCGVGQLMDMLRDNAITCRGFDVSEFAVSICGRKGHQVLVDSAEEHGYGSFGAYVCTEVLEHLEDDIAVIKLWPKGQLVLFSVPIFMDRSHVRCFPDKKSIKEHYHGVLNIEKIWPYKRRHLVKARVK